MSAKKRGRKKKEIPAVEDIEKIIGPQEEVYYNDFLAALQRGGRTPREEENELLEFAPDDAVFWPIKH